MDEMERMEHKDTTMEKLLLRPTEVAEAIGLGRSKTYELIASGTLPSITIGKSRRVPAEALRAWVAEQQTKAAQVGTVNSTINSRYHLQ